MISKKIRIFLVRSIKASFRSLFKVKSMTLHGVKLNLNHHNISPNLRTFFYNESYEGEEITILSKSLKDNDIVMEIGAGIGFLSTFCAQMIGSNRVYAYEANPFMIDKIKKHTG